MSTAQVALLSVIAAGTFFVAVVLLLRDEPVFGITRNYRMNPTLHTVEDLRPDDVVIMEIPEATEDEANAVRQNLADAGLVNAVVVNRELTDVKLGDIHIDSDEVVDPR